jgi:hypothetical protein
VALRHRQEDGQHLLIGADDYRLRLWDVTGAKEV